ncbi:MAG: translation elongation factor Ts [Candidatus Paceibacterota bacterium]|jgi:elongation factor Ts
MSNDIALSLIKELRDATGVSVMQCKNALQEASGDMKKALAILKKTSSDIALKKAGRDAKDGRVSVKTEGNRAVLVALHCETDFVSKNEDFVNLLSKLTNEAIKDSIEKMRENAKDMIDPIIQKTGEKIELGDVSEIKGDILGNYVHNNKSAVIVSLEGGNEELARDIAMHITAMKPEYIFQSDITEEIKNTMKEIFQKEITNIDKPEDIKKKMLDGKMSTYFKEKTLLDQIFIKDPNITISQLLDKNKAKIKEVKRYSI